MGLLSKAVYEGLYWASLRSKLKFEQALKNPQAAQCKILQKILCENSNTQFFQNHQISGIDNIIDLRKRLPVQSYTEVAPWIEKIKCGESCVLTRESPMSLCPTSGNESGQKWIPYTSALKKEFMNGVLPWLHDLLRSYPAIQKGRAYWMVTPSMKFDRQDSEVPMGFEEDSSYFGSKLKFLLPHLLVMPEEANSIASSENFIYFTLYKFLAAEDLSWISLWNPSLLLNFFEKIPKYRESLCRDIFEGHLTWPQPLDKILKWEMCNKADARRSRYVEKNIESLHLLWPRLALISCWGDGWAGLALKTLQEVFPQVAIQGKGLLATEGLVSIPYQLETGGVCGVNSHFLEFEELDNGECVGVHELIYGKTYSIILTQGGGLYRYRLGDEVEVVGKIFNTPRIRFLRREGKMVDMIGEKMNGEHVEKMLTSLYSNLPTPPTWSFLSPLPKAQAWIYTLFLPNSFYKSCSKENLERDLERALCENVYYRHGREMGQLCSAKLIGLDDPPPRGKGQWSAQKIDYLREPGDWNLPFLELLT